MTEAAEFAMLPYQMQSITEARLSDGELDQARAHDGGGFQGGARTESHSESVPIASVGKIKIVSIDYRQAPKYTFPSASEDVEAIYRDLLKTYKPSNIGIYGCSAGGLLTAQSIAWFQKKGLPIPGALGCSAKEALTGQKVIPPYARHPRQPDRWRRRSPNHDEIEEFFRSGIPQAAKAGVANVITFSGQRHGMSDEEGVTYLESARDGGSQLAECEAPV